MEVTYSRFLFWVSEIFIYCSRTLAELHSSINMPLGLRFICSQFSLVTACHVGWTFNKINQVISLSRWYQLPYRNVAVVFYYNIWKFQGPGVDTRKLIWNKLAPLRIFRKQVVDNLNSAIFLPITRIRQLREFRVTYISLKSSLPKLSNHIWVLVILHSWWRIYTEKCVLDVIKNCKFGGQRADKYAKFSNLQMRCM